MIYVKFYGIEKIFAQIDAVGNERELEIAVGQAITFVQGAAKEKAHINTGELREKIFTSMESKGGAVKGIVYTNVPQGFFQEFGTGPKGEANHSGISPEASPVYTQEPWWIHESMVDHADAERYRWFYIDTAEGRFYQITGQAADPFLYPALKNNEDNIIEIISRHMKKSTGGK